MRIGVPPAVRALPAEPGVYRFLDSRGTVLYLGRATALRARVASYWAADLGDRRHLALMVSRVTRIEAVRCGGRHPARLGGVRRAQRRACCGAGRRPGLTVPLTVPPPGAGREIGLPGRPGGGDTDSRCRAGARTAGAGL